MCQVFEELAEKRVNERAEEIRVEEKRHLLVVWLQGES